MTPNAQPVAYLRKSKAASDGMDRSKDVQLSAVARLAARDGLTIAQTYDADWNKSGGRKGRGRRTGEGSMAELIAAVRAGDVSVIYVYTLDRIARDAEYSLTLRNACQDQDVVVVTDEDRYDLALAKHRKAWGQEAVDSEAELDKITKKNLDVKADLLVHVADCPLPGRETVHYGDCKYQAADPRGHCTWAHVTGGFPPYGHDPIGHPGEAVEFVIDAYTEAGYSATKACGILAGRGLRPRRGKVWTVRAVLDILRRAQVEVRNSPGPRVPMPRDGTSASRTYLFSGLLVCPFCGRVLTVHKRMGRVRTSAKLVGTFGPPSISYQCETRKTGAHPKRENGDSVGMVAESKIRSWAEPEAEGWREARLTADVSAKPTGPTAADLAKRRAGIAMLVAEGSLPPEAARKALAKLAAQAGSAEAAETRNHWLSWDHAIDWSKSPADVNAALRNIWTAIRLGPDMLPVEGVEWPS